MDVRADCVCSLPGIVAGLIVKSLFLSSRPESFNPAKDTTRALMERAGEIGAQVFTATHADIGFADGRVTVHARRMSFPGDPWFSASAPEWLDVSDFDTVWFREDPPFDDVYLHATQLIEMVPDIQTINSPAGLRFANEKILALRFPELMPRTLVARDRERIRGFIEEVGGTAVVKPLDGFGGSGIFRAALDDPNLASILQSATNDGQNWTMAQAFIPDVDKGDTRVLLMDGQIIGAICRIPTGGDFRGNMMQGGVVEPVDPADVDTRIVDAVKPLLQEYGLRLVGLDIVGGFLTEINVTSPTGFQEVRKLTGERPEVAVWNAVLDEGAL